MGSFLYLLDINDLQKEIISKVKELKDSVGVIVLLDKPTIYFKKALEKEKINLDKIFFIDCVSKTSEIEESICISPDNLEELEITISEFIKDIKRKIYVLIDTLSILLIYNSESKVANFIKNLITLISKSSNVDLLAFSVKTKGEDLLNNISMFFDEVINGKEKNRKVKNSEDLIY